MKEALHYAKIEDQKVRCLLCPHECVISSGNTGICGVRENREGTLYSLVYARPCAVHTDPIEKKPLYHFLPGSRSLSIGTTGCNMQCKHCQNWSLSRAKPGEVDSTMLGPGEAVKYARISDCTSISYTYNEPGINYEYVHDTAMLARSNKLKNVMVTNGYMSKAPLMELYKHIDAANIDLKGFSEDFYRKICGASLEPVLESIKAVKELGVWIEITNLVIPGYNDDPGDIRKLCRWVAENAGAGTPLHFTAFFPTYKLKDAPHTPQSTLIRAGDIAREEGLNFIYTGNIRADNFTECPICGAILISRGVTGVIQNNIINGKCSCGNDVPGVWE